MLSAVGGGGGEIKKMIEFGRKKYLISSSDKSGTRVVLQRALMSKYSSVQEESVWIKAIKRWWQRREMEPFIFNIK